MFNNTNRTNKNVLMNPLVTILIPTYKRPEYLAMAIESVIAQTYANWEIFVFDNSPDNETEKIMKYYLNHYFTGFKQHKIVDLPACIVSSGSFRHFLAS